MSRFHALVLVPGDARTPMEEACEAAAELLYPFMRSEDDPDGDCEFDWFLQPDDLYDPDDNDRLMWPVDDIVERFAELQVEAILTAPVLLGLFSTVTLFADGYLAKKNANAMVRRAAWFEKQRPTFSDALALVRKELWAQEATFFGSHAKTDAQKDPRVLVQRLTDAVCYTA